MQGWCRDLADVARPDSRALLRVRVVLRPTHDSGGSPAGPTIGRTRPESGRVLASKMRLECPLPMGVGGWRGATAEQRLQELERDLSALLANERALMTSPSPQGLCDQILRQAISATAADAGSVFLRDPSGRLIVASAAGERAEAVRQYSLPAGLGIAGAVAESGKPVLTDAASDPRHDRATAMRLEYPVEGILAVPITDEGRVIGVIEVLTRHGSGKKFDDADVRLLEIMAGQAARAIEAARLLDQRMRSERLEALGMVIRGVVHDVRNPLTFINGYAEMVAEEASPAERIKARDAIFRNVDDINEMLKELADFVSGDDTVHKNPGDLVAVAKEVMAHFKSRADKMKIRQIGRAHV